MRCRSGLWSILHIPFLTKTFLLVSFNRQFRKKLIPGYLSQPRGKPKVGKKVWVLEVEADDATKETIIQAADVCPVAVIAVFNVETGEKLV